MSGNQYIKSENKERDKMFELLVVFSVIALLLYIGSQYLEHPFTGSKIAIVDHHAGVFSRAITTIHAMGGAAGQRKVATGAVEFYLNENGWPANTSTSFSPSLTSQTAQECQQLWHSVFSNAPSSMIEGDSYNKSADYLISLKKNVICRYELAGKQEASYFFDYDVSSGEVVVVRPE